MRLTYGEYNKRFPQSNDYLKSHFNDTSKYKCIESGMILWEDQPERWGGPWEGSFAAFVFRDHTKDLELKSCNEIFTKHKHYANTSKYNVPASTLKKLGWESQSEYWHMIYIDKDGRHTLCSRSELTEEELEILQNKMTDEEKIEWELNIMKCVCGRDLNPLTCVSKEKPFSIYFFGNDDCSYTAVFKNKKIAKEFLDMIILIPRWSRLEDVAIFTN